MVGGSCQPGSTAETCVIDLRTQNTTLKVPVEARTAGVYPLKIDLTSPDGSLPLASAQYTVRSTAASGVGIVLSIGAALLLALWWGRDLHHGRRARQLVPAGAEGSDGGDGGDGRDGVVPPDDAVDDDFDLPWPTPPSSPVADASAVAARPPSVPQPPPGRRSPVRPMALSGAITQPIPVISGDGQPPSPVPVLAAGASGPSGSWPNRSDRFAPGREHPSQPAALRVVRLAPVSWPVVPAVVVGRAMVRLLPAVVPSGRRCCGGWSERCCGWGCRRCGRRRRLGAVGRGRCGIRRSGVVAGRRSRDRAAPGPPPAPPPGSGAKSQGAGPRRRRSDATPPSSQAAPCCPASPASCGCWPWSGPSTSTRLGDVYNIANTVPNILYDLVLGGVLSATLIPVFVDYLGRDDEDEGWRAVSAVCTVIFVSLLVLSAVFWLLVPAIIHFYLIFNHSAGAADERAIGTTLLRLFVPQLFLLGGIAVTTALLNARRRFAAAAFSPVLNNLVCIGAIVATRLVATRPRPRRLPPRPHRALLILPGLGTTAGYLAQLLVQLPALVRGRFHLRPVWDLHHPAVRTVLRLSIWTFGAVLANQVAFNLVLVLAGKKSGDVVVFTTAYQFFQLPYAIFAVSIAAVVTPDLSDRWAKADVAGFRLEMALGLRLTLAIVVPAAVGYVGIGPPVP